MELENSFVVPAGLDAAWAKLLDVEAVAPCMPGATLTGHEGDEFEGSVKVKLGPVTMVYNGTARFAERDDAAHRAVIEAAGKDTKGTSTARAAVRAQLTAESEDSTRVDVVTDLAITGRPAQFGRGVMQDVAGRIIDQFAENLAHVMGAEAQPSSTETSVAEPSATAAPSGEDAEPASDTATVSEGAGDETAAAAVPEEPRPHHGMPHAHDAIDIVEAAAAPVLKRLAPVIAGLLLGWLVWRLVRRRR